MRCFVRSCTFCPRMPFSGTNFCTGDFAPPEPDFRAEFWEKKKLDARILDPNSWAEFFDSVFCPAKAPRKIHPREIHLPKFTFQNSTQKSGTKFHIAPLQGHLADLFFFCLLLRDNCCRCYACLVLDSRYHDY